jgi:spore coat polysaccharide biosynthesis protein SpsF
MLVILQGRLRSTRLPCKGFFNFFGQTILERMCDIAKELSCSSEVVFATGDLRENYLAKPIVENKGVRFYAGSEENVLKRFYDVALTSEAKYIIRITCDNYLVQPEVIEGLLKATAEENADYGFISPLSHFSGEVVKREILLKQWESGCASDEALEHVTWDIRKDASLKHVTLPSNFKGIDHSQRITLDTVDDFIFMKELEAEYPELSKLRCIEVLKKLQKRVV